MGRIPINWYTIFNYNMISWSYFPRQYPGQTDDFRIFPRNFPRKPMIFEFPREISRENLWFSDFPISPGNFPEDLENTWFNVHVWIYHILESAKENPTGKVIDHLLHLENPDLFFTDDYDVRRCEKRRRIRPTVVWGKGKNLQYYLLSLHAMLIWRFLLGV